MIILSYAFYFIAASASPLWRRWLGKNRNPENFGQISFSFQVTLVALVLGCLVLPIFEPFYLSGNAIYIWSLVLICGIFGSFHLVALYTIQKHVEAGVSSLIGNIYTPVTILMSTFLLHEGLTLEQIVGTVFLLSAMLIVSQNHKIGRFKFDKYFWLTIFSGVMLAVLLVSQRAIMITSGFSASIILSWAAICVFLGLTTLFTKNKNVYSKKEIVITGTLKFLQDVSWVTLVYVIGNLSFVSSITTFKVVVMFILGAIFLREREDLPRKIFGSIIAVIGLLLMR